MCKFNQNFRSLFWKILFLCSIAHHVFADDVLWESGINLYIKLDKQDKSVSGKTTPNNHPVELSEKHIAESLDLEVHAGHGLTYQSAKKLSKIKGISEFNVGHFIVSESLFVGLSKSIKKFRKIINK